mmetsp:Transcript_78854/g.254729  ORF Transcript_78854/g.254729 Transcript_78854/m.254729 type:complete len:246 (+) Transcript_78854:864-1601(+)
MLRTAGWLLVAGTRAMTHRVAPPRTPPRCKLQRAVLLQDRPGQVLLHVANLVELRIFEQVAATCRKAGAVELLAHRLHLACVLDVLWRRRTDLLPTPTVARASPSGQCPRQRPSHHRRRSHLHFLQHTKCVRIRLGLKGSVSSCQHSGWSSRAHPILHIGAPPRSWSRLTRPPRHARPTSSTRHASRDRHSSNSLLLHRDAGPRCKSPFCSSTLSNSTILSMSCQPPRWSSRARRHHDRDSALGS